MTTLKVWNKDKGEQSDDTFTFTTESKSIKDAVYNYKRRHNIKYTTQYRVVENIKPVVKYNNIIEKVKAETPNKNTAGNYVRNLQKFIDAGGKYDDFKSIKEYNSKLPVNQREGFLYSIMKANTEKDKLIEQLRSLVRESKGLVKMERVKKAEEGQPIDKPNISLAELKNKADEIPADNKTYKFVADLYTKEVPWRADTVVGITNDKKEKGYNIFKKDKNELQLNRYKTVKTYKKRDVKLSAEINELMKQQFKNTGSKWLLPSPSDKTKPMEANTLGKIINKIFGLGVIALRHIYITHAKANFTREKFLSTCDRMNTSAECGLLVYNDRLSVPQKEETRKANMDETMGEDLRTYDDSE